jgi:hypothetical protein
MNYRIMIVTGGLLLLSACDKEQPPTSVTSFMENPLLLEAAVVRCNADRDATRYEPECVNAREAALLTDAIESRARKQQLEEESERKLRDLRASRDAIDLARLRLQEEEQKRKEAEYLSQFQNPAADEAAAPAPADGELTNPTNPVPKQN